MQKILHQKERNDRTIETGNSSGNRFEGFGWDIVLLFYVVLCCCPYTWQFDAPPLPSPPSGRVALSLNHFCCWAVGLLFPGQKEEEGKKKKTGWSDSTTYLINWLALKQSCPNNWLIGSNEWGEPTTGSRWTSWGLHHTGHFLLLDTIHRHLQL